MSELVKRIITGVIGAAIFIGSILYSNWSFVLIFLAINIAASGEYFRIIKKINKEDAKKIDTFFYILFAAAIYSTSIFALFYGKWYSLIIVAIILYFIFQYYISNINNSKYTSLWQQLLGFLYVVWPFVIINILAYYNFNNEFNPFIVLGILLIMWSNDIMAYFVGKKYGKTPLAKKISPNKTVEGFAGGMVGSLLMAAIVYYAVPNGYGIHWFGVALIIAIAGPIGDLFQSGLKRKAEIKDSGFLLPGHGGFLDRFDALIFALPFVFLYLLYFL